MKFFTIGVFHSTEKAFFDKLTENQIDTFCDIRQRRGVRGAQYSFVNSNALQQKLNSLDIKYVYIPELAPTTEIRALQKPTDLEKGETNKDRKQLGNEVIAGYKNIVLKQFDFDAFLEKLDQAAARSVVFFCVEESARACHRSIVADELEVRFNQQVRHL